MSLRKDDLADTKGRDAFEANRPLTHGECVSGRRHPTTVAEYQWFFVMPFHKIKAIFCDPKLRVQRLAWITSQRWCRGLMPGPFVCRTLHLA